MRKVILAIFMVCILSTTCFAGAIDLDVASVTTQKLLEDLTREVGYIIAPPSMTPSDPMGITGFDIGAEASVLKLDESETLFKDSAIGMTRIHLQKGLPFNIDIGVEFSNAPETNVEAVAGEIRWAVLAGNLALPAIGLRATYSELNGVDDFDLTTYTLGAQISKKVLFITPYAGATYLSSKGKISGSTLKSEEVSNENVYVGVNFSALVINFALQADFSDSNMYTMKLGVGF